MGRCIVMVIVLCSNSTAASIRMSLIIRIRICCFALVVVLALLCLQRFNICSFRCLNVSGKRKTGHEL